ncbi:6-bladed beta-propeller [Algoriphagus formosus]|uniref:6-bladed beta-propeller n=1 Tax=Algoriphagus formosus TaxID=2007308 RepID=UPI000C285920|nr:6-bladed beta-propeller [Algoriphagus formosus]
MKSTKIIFFLILASLFQYCKEKGDPKALESVKTIEIQVDVLKGDSPEFIPEKLDSINLELPGNPPLTSIQDLVFSQNFFLLLDRKQGLLKFDNNGKFLLKIGEFGEGPDEYAMPYAVQLDEKKNIVYVADWQKMVILTYSLEGNFESTSSKLPGHPISFYKENDSLLVVQETINGTKEQPREVIISSLKPNSLEIVNGESPVYSFHSNFTTIHPIPRILSRVRNSSLFYMPIILGEISSHSDRDSIFRKQGGRLSPEYLLHFIGFDNTLQLGINQMVMSDAYAFLRVVYDNRSYFLGIDLESNSPPIHLKKLFNQEMTDEMIPKPFKGDVYYSILRDKENALEKNPQLVFYRVPEASN